MVDPQENYFQTNIKYSITLNPIDKYQFFGRPNRFARFRNFIYENLFILKEIEYEFFIELSEPKGFHTQGYSGPRLHLHGTILFPRKQSLTKFLLHHYYALLRFTSVDIDTITDTAVWYSYCTKQKLIANNRLSSFSLSNIS